MKDLTDDKGHKSSMRMNNRILTITCSILIITLSIYIIILAYKGEPISGGEWTGIGAFVTGIGALLTGVYYNQTKNKKTESKLFDK